MAAPTVEEVTRVAEMDDGTIASLYPQYQQYVRLLRTEGMDALGRVLHGEHKPEREYSAQRARLLGQLARLDDIEGRLREEREKTGRTTYMSAAQIVMALAGIEKAGVTARGNVLAAQMDAWTKRLAQLDKDNDVNGPRSMGDLDTVALRSVNAIGRVASNGQVTDGVTFATELQNGLRGITDDRLITPYLDQIQERTGVDATAWLMGQPTNLPIAPIVKSAQDRITAGLAAEEKALEIKIANDEEAKNVTERLKTNIGVESGSMLGRAFNNFEQATGVSPLTSTGGTTTTTTTTGKPGEPAAGEPSAIDETRKRINDELDRLQNGTDSASQQAREQLLVSPQLAEWAERNGYTNFRPEQQLRAFVAFAKKRVEEQDDAFRAKLDEDILGGRIKAPTIRGEVINQVGARVRQAVRGVGRPSADLTGGAKGPEDTAPEISESAPRDTGPEPTAEDMAKKETSDDVFAGEIERGLEDVGRTGAAVTSAQALRGRGNEPPQKPRSNVEQMMAARIKNEQDVQRVLNNPDYASVKKRYDAIQGLKGTDPVAYATELDTLGSEVRRSQEFQPRLGVVRVPGEPTPLSGTLADYDENKNGLIDEEELALMEKADLPPPTGGDQKPQTVPLGTLVGETDIGAQLQTERDLEATTPTKAVPAPEEPKRRTGLLRRFLGRDKEAAPEAAPAPAPARTTVAAAPVETPRLPTRREAPQAGYDAPTPRPSSAPKFGELAPEAEPGMQPTTSNQNVPPTPGLFTSFGAETATSQAQQAMDAYQQALAERRARRRQMMTGMEDPGLYEMGLRR